MTGSCFAGRIEPKEDLKYHMQAHRIKCLIVVNLKFFS